MTSNLAKHPITLVCDISLGTGYHNAMRGLLASLNYLGYDASTVRLMPAILENFSLGAEGYQEEGVELTPYMMGPWEGENDADRIRLVHLNPGMVGDYWTSVRGRYNIAYTTWETDALPQKRWKRQTVLAPPSKPGGTPQVGPGETSMCVLDGLNQFDEIWVPCQWVKTMFEREGVKPPITVVPHALRPEVLRRDVKPREGGPVTFCSVGAWNARKDMEMLLQAYFRADFNPLSNVALQIHTVPPSRNKEVVYAHGQMAQAAFRDMRHSLPDALSAPPVNLFTTYRSYSRVLDLYAGADIYISASHGEGFGLPALEALAMGCIAVGYGPWLEELQANIGEDSVEVLDYELTPVASMPEVRGYEPGQNWWTVNPRALTDAFTGWTEAFEANGRPQAYTWAKRARQLYNPARIAERVLAPRFEEINRVLDNAGW